MNIKNSVTELIGKTPLLRLQRCEKAWDVQAELIVKLEAFNPAAAPRTEWETI